MSFHVCRPCSSVGVQRVVAKGAMLIPLVGGKRGMEADALSSNGRKGNSGDGG